MQMQDGRQIKEIIGANLRQRRDELGLSRRIVAQRLGTDQGALYKWERGMHRPQDETLVALAALLGRDVGWFYVDHSADEVAA